MTKTETQAEAEKAGPRWLPARRNAPGTMALVAVGRGRSGTLPCPEAPEAPPPARHLRTEEDIVLFQGGTRDDLILAGFNFTPLPRHDYRVGVPRGGHWKELLNSDAVAYGGGGLGNYGGVEAARAEWHHRPYSLTMTLPPLAAVFFLSRGDEAA
jgi:hypothetical protein